MGICFYLTGIFFTMSLIRSVFIIPLQSLLNQIISILYNLFPVKTCNLTSLPDFFSLLIISQLLPQISIHFLVFLYIFLFSFFACCTLYMAAIIPTSLFFDAICRLRNKSEVTSMHKIKKKNEQKIYTPLRTCIKVIMVKKLLVLSLYVVSKINITLIVFTHAQRKKKDQ